MLFLLSSPPWPREQTSTDFDISADYDLLLDDVVVGDHTLLASSSSSATSLAAELTTPTLPPTQSSSSTVSSPANTSVTNSNPEPKLSAVDEDERRYTSLTHSLLLHNSKPINRFHHSHQRSQQHQQQQILGHLLSRSYSNSSASSSEGGEMLSSIECSETSSVDENFACNGDNGDESSDRLNCETWMGSAERTDVDGSQSQRLASVQQDRDGEDEGETEENQEREGLVRDEPPQSETQITSTTTTSSASSATEQQQIVDSSSVAPSSAIALQVTTPSHNNISNNDIQQQALDLATTIPLPNKSDADLSSSSSSSEQSSKPTRRSSLSRATPHACSTCYLYAPSTSLTFYMDAWLNQQHAFYPPKSGPTTPTQPEPSTFKPRKKVSWPTTDFAMKTVIHVERWIERGVHAYPNPAPRSRDSLDDGDDSETDEEDLVLVERLVSAGRANRGWISVPRKTSSSEEDDDKDSVGSATSIRADPAYRTAEERAGMEGTLKTLGLVAPTTPSRDATPSLSSSSSVSDLSVNSSEAQITPTPTPKPQLRQRPQLQHRESSNYASSRNASPNRSPPGTPTTATQTPKRKFASGVKVTVIGGPASADSEHEMAVRIRGADPIRHRSMIENYWQY